MKPYHVLIIAMIWLAGATVATGAAAVGDLCIGLVCLGIYFKSRWPK